MSGGSFKPHWGAHLGTDGHAHFCLWAPAVETLELELGSGERLPMAAVGGGWFELGVNGLAEGVSYSFRLPDGQCVPDPAARAQLSDVNGPSLLTSSAFDWQCQTWVGRPWEEAVIYELHPGTFTADGTFAGIIEQLDHLADLGITAIELMPVSQFAGERGWGYDGVLLYCPHRAYGGVQGMKRLVDAAHQRGLMVFLDVVYNHFGPEGNHLPRYAPDFFDPERQTPWGAGIHYSEPAVRAFFLDNALYWLAEFRLDGLRFDAIDHVIDQSEPFLLEEMAARIRESIPDRHIHLMTEDERNIVELHPYDERNRPLLHTAEWNDDFHHAAHCLATGETGGYYAAFADDPLERLGKSLAKGFVYQGEPYAPWDGKARGVASSGQPPQAFVVFLQNHDQIGNRAFGERLTRLTDPQTYELLLAVLLLNPQVPLLFMGEEYGETRPFLFFTDFHGDLAHAVREGRRREFKAFPEFSDEKAAAIPDPNAPATFEACRLDWAKASMPEGKARAELVRELLAIRKREISPLLPHMRSFQGRMARLAPEALYVCWQVHDELLSLHLNLGAASCVAIPGRGTARLLYESRGGSLSALRQGQLPGHSLIFTLERAGRQENGL
ncbi:malto-oligosyltrehalose trehalohydrolase [Aquibaculum sediminis]|uniref:malto-oligosyltrehalose trehalohydrolase n=1 Tax=Aquibaculum sediminis TaxID=3231907 RepID=UPI003453C356